MREDIIKLISQGEGYNTEFKEGPDKDLAAEVCAFANASGGRIFIGVNDQGKIVGTDTSNTARSRIQDSINQVEPRPVTSLEVIDDVIVITVNEGKKKPYSCSKGFILRTGPNSQKLERYEIVEFMQSEDLFQYDNVVRKKYPIKDNFNEESYKKFVQKAKISETLPRDSVLVKLDCAGYDDNGELVFTNAGALFFRDNTEDFHFMEGQVVCALFKGVNKAMTIDAKWLNGGIMDNIDDAMKFLWKNLRVRHEFGGIQRKEILEIPVDALREAVINAVCHRNYFERGITVSVEIYDDRVEISNPGGIPKGMKEGEFGKKSVPRNPVIAGMLNRADYIERMGTGIWKMEKAMAEARLEPPIFTSTFFFTAVFKRPPMYDPSMEKVKGDTSMKLPTGITEIEIKICELVNENEKITAAQISETLGISESTVKRHFKSLIKKGIIRRIGSRKEGSWKLSEY